NNQNDFPTRRSSDLKRNNKKAMYSKTSAKRAKAIFIPFKFIKKLTLEWKLPCLNAPYCVAHLLIIQNAPYFLCTFRRYVKTIVFVTDIHYSTRFSCIPKYKM